MTFSEKHFTLRWRIESKPEGGYIARTDNPADTIEGATREEIEAKVREKLAARLGPEFSGRDLAQSGVHFEADIGNKVLFSLGNPRIGKFADAPTPAQLQDGTPGSVGAVGGSLLGALWKAAVLAGIGIIIWLLLQRH
jgi:hypothetical protein